MRDALLSLTPRLAKAAHTFIRGEGWKEFGYARLSDHARERWGRSARWVRDLAALHIAVRRLPGLSTAMTGGDGEHPLSLEAARQLGRVASSGSLPSWLRLARGMPCRGLKLLVRDALAAGSAWPVQQQSPAATSHRLTSGTSQAGCGTSPRVGPSAPALSSGPLMGSSLAGGDTAPSELVCLRVPAAVRDAFAEAYDLYQAVEGGAAPEGEFIESLLSEARSGSLAGLLEPEPDDRATPDPGPQPCGPDELSVGAREGCSHSAEIADSLDIGPTGGRVVDSTDRDTLGASVAGSSDSAEAVAPYSDASEPTSSRTADARFGRITRLQGILERRLAGILARMADAAAWRSLGYTNLGDYAENGLGWSRSTLYTRVQLEKHLRRLPIVRRAYQAGALTMSAAQALARYLTGPTSSGAVPLRVPEDIQRAWVDRASRATFKRLQDEIRATVRQRVPPGEEATDSLEASSRADRRETSSRDGAGSAATHPGPLDDGAWHTSLRRRAGSTRRLLRTLGTQALECPGPLVDLRLCLPSQTAHDLRRVLSAVRTDPTLVQMFSLRRGGVPEWAAFLALLGEFVAVWDVDLSARRPSLQRIYIRDGWRCMAPGCTSRRNLETHHVTYRSQGGGDEDENLVCLCRFHHQMGEHGVLARVRGTAPLDLAWELGRGGCGGRFRNEIRLTD